MSQLRYAHFIEYICFNGGTESQHRVLYEPQKLWLE